MEYLKFTHYLKAYTFYCNTCTYISTVLALQLCIELIHAFIFSKESLHFNNMYSSKVLVVKYRQFIYVLKKYSCYSTVL